MPPTFIVSTGTQTKDDTDVSTALAHEGLYEVILYNDEVNDMLHVLMCIQHVFGHSLQLAQKIMLEAHHDGKAVAEVEAKERAQLHKDQLQSYGLTAEIEKIQ